MDRASYELGKSVFTGNYAPSANGGDKATQVEELTSLQARLPRSVRDRANLAGYAGELSDEQMEALRYYLKKRYKLQ